jgi:hypothetical protein
LFEVFLVNRANIIQLACMSATTEATLVIVGYSEDDVCAHCNKTLRHGIRLDDGRVVGAQCFNKVLTLPQTYGGKSYRVGAENIIRYAKIAEFHTLSEGEKRFGVGLYQRTFKATPGIEFKA